MHRIMKTFNITSYQAQWMLGVGNMIFADRTPRLQ